MQKMVGERIGKHEVICLLSEGGMAEVYLGCSRGPADVIKLVVMKLVRTELAKDERFVSMFLDEARLATRLNHPNIVHTYEVLRDAGRYVLTMEYLDGQSLLDTVQRIGLQLFPLEEHLWIITQILVGLEYAHTLPNYDGSPLGIVHRDVSPANTFITYDGDVKLLDFGIAKAAGALCVTQKGTFKGKLNYCAPEQIQSDDPPDARSDLFAVGVMLWEAIAGRPIGSGETFAATAQARLAGSEPRIRAVRPDVAPDLAEICEHAMAVKPAHRYLTAASLQRDLERHLERRERRVGRTQVAELMRRYWGAERNRMRRIIEEHLQPTRNGAGVLGETPPRVGGVTEYLVRLRSQPMQPRGRTEPAMPEVMPPDDEHSEASTPKDIAAAEAFAPRGISFTEALTQRDIGPLVARQPKPAVADDPVAISASPHAGVESAAGQQRSAGRQRSASWRTIIIAATALFATSFVAVGLWKRIHTRTKIMAYPSNSPSSVPSRKKPNDSPPPILSAPPSPVQAPSPATIRLDIRVMPRGAKLTFDGKAVSGNWLRAEVPKDGSVHTIRAFTPGYFPFNQSISHKADVHLDIHLKGEPPRHRLPAGHGTKPGSPAIKSRSQAQPTASPKPSRPKSQTSESARPGVNLEGPAQGRPGEQIDSLDPFEL